MRTGFGYGQSCLRRAVFAHALSLFFPSLLPPVAEPRLTAAWLGLRSALTGTVHSTGSDWQPSFSSNDLHTSLWGLLFLVLPVGSACLAFGLAYFRQVKKTANANELLLIERAKRTRAERRLEQDRNLYHQTVATKTKEVETAIKCSESAYKARADFIAGISREIRGSMRRVRESVERLGCTSMDREQRSELRAIDVSAKSLLQTADDVLDFSALEAGNLEARLDPVKIKNLVEAVVSGMVAQAHKKGIELHLFIDTRIAEVLVSDERRVFQIVTKLLENAVNFTEKGSVSFRVSVREETADRQDIRFEVHDTGGRIRPEEQEALFSPFHAGGTSGNGRPSDLGLGLAFCRRLAQLMGGDLSVESEAGKGSSLVFTQAMTIRERFRKNRPFKRDPVLVLGVEPVEGSQLQQYLLDFGFSVETSPELPTLCDLQDRSAAERPAALFLFENFLAAHRITENQIVNLAQRLALPAIVILDSPYDGQLQKEHPQGISYIAGHPLLPSDLQQALDVALCQRAVEEPFGGDASRSRFSIEGPTGAAKVLVAEYQPVTRMLTKQQVSFLGYPVEAVSDGYQALKLWEHGCYDLLLTDCFMPYLDGFQLTRIIREKEKRTHLHLPIIAVTHYSRGEEVDRCIRCGMDDLLPQPLSLDRLRKKMERFLNGPCGHSDLNVENAKLIDLSYLQQIFGSKNSVVSFLGEFLDQNDKDLAILAWAIEQRDAVKARSVVHRINGAARTIGAMGLARACLSLGMALKKGEWREAGIRLTQMSTISSSVGEIVASFK